MPRVALAAACLFALLLATFPARPAAGPQLAFATAAEGRRMLATEDPFVARMSPFDRAARMKTDREVATAEYLEFAGASALDWEPAERAKVEAAMRHVREALARTPLPLPARVHVIKTSGREEGNAPYTRGNAIVLPLKFLSAPDAQVRVILAHELFHLATRARPGLAAALYEAIGFRHCGEVELPPELAARKITNPDAPRNEHAIEVRLGGQRVWAVPILLSRVPRYEPARGGEFFQYLQLELLLVENPDGAGRPRWLRGPDGPRRVKLEDVSGFYEQVGRNTKYVIHPEEILADNFALLALGGEVRSPEVLERLKAALAKARP